MHAHTDACVLRRCPVNIFLPPDPTRLQYGEGYWTNTTNRNLWYQMLLRARTPPDAIYQPGCSSGVGCPLRPEADYVYLAEHGVQWMAILDVTALPLVPGGALPAAAGSSRGRMMGSRVGGSCANYTEEYVHRLIATLKPIVDALDAQGILGKAYVYGFDENPISCEPQVRKLFGATKAAFPKLRTAAVLNWSVVSYLRGSRSASYSYRHGDHAG